MASEETKEVFRLTEKFYEEMRRITPKFSTNDREHMLIITAITLAVRAKHNA